MNCGRQEKYQSTVNELTVQNQELQYNGNSLDDSREFYDLETAISSGLSNVHVIVPSPSWKVSPRLLPAA